MLAGHGAAPAPDRQYVLYWMQASQRAECNHALEYAVQTANRLRKPLLVFFGITDSFPEANERHYRFMIEGLRETQAALERRGVRMIVRHVSPPDGAAELSRDAALAVVDAGYLRIEREWRKQLADCAACPLVQVETNVVVPVQEAYGKEAFSAGVFRPRISRLLDDYLVPLKPVKPVIESLSLKLPSLELHDIDTVMARLSIDRSVAPVSTFCGGASHARRLLRQFIDNKLDRYAADRNNPALDSLSHMSPYLHFGQISPLQIALEVIRSGKAAVHTYLEELIVRRELSMNFVHYNLRYDSFDGLPEWCKRELIVHAKDKREQVYTLEQLEAAQTGDPYWNAAQNEMICTGKMHGYMRMYWGKKLLEWVRPPQEAYRIALHLNNKYELDGRDANGFTGVAWCFGKHDRAWASRPVFGKVRYMNAAGLKRKFDADAYAAMVEMSCLHAQR